MVGNKKSRERQGMKVPAQGRRPKINIANNSKNFFCIQRSTKKGTALFFAFLTFFSLLSTKLLVPRNGRRKENI